MQYVNKIIILRFVNILLIIWLIFQLDKIFDQISRWKFIKNLENYGEEENKELLSDLPLYIPNPTENLEFESIRLNELLARPIYKCLDRRTLGGYKDSFFVCFDKEMGINNEIFENGLSINGQKIPKENENFEISLNITNWTLIIPKRNNLVEKLENNVLLLFMPELEEKGYIPEDRIALILNNEKEQFNITKIDLDTELLNENKKNTKIRIELLNWILKILKTKQLLINLKPGLDNLFINDKKGNILFLLYKFIYSLFFKFNYALLGARSNGRCGQALQKFDYRHCEWRLSFIYFNDLYSINDIPAYGTGSPLEEKLRFLQNNNKLIYLLPFPLCSELNEIFNLFIYFRYKPFLNEELIQLEQLLELTEKIIIFYPKEFKRNNSIFNNNKILFINEGISPFLNKTILMPLKIKDKNNNNILFNLLPFVDLLNKINLLKYQKNVLFFDIDGSEWDILEIITNKIICDNWLRSFKQIIFKIRIWTMEESENWRHFYLWFLRLEECEFKKAFRLPVIEPPGKCSGNTLKRQNTYINREYPEKTEYCNIIGNTKNYNKNTYINREYPEKTEYCNIIGNTKNYNKNTYINREYPEKTEYCNIIGNTKNYNKNTYINREYPEKTEYCNIMENTKNYNKNTYINREYPEKTEYCNIMENTKNYNKNTYINRKYTV
ncbi:hypothetical protein Mgra_00004251 [Meloidogyne graminicola]|uniref:Uncharacterized protein n=1 Tax=Meloidogyne graminicola TaxID=189291 RepID=A0A8S9ZSA0_9BILA|nr:hypothetical protein Mgra_00004251 [Meloidogyne graminicola]